MTNGSVVTSWAAYSHGFGRDQIHFTLADAERASPAIGQSSHPLYFNLLIPPHQLMAPGSIVWFGPTTPIRISMTLLPAPFSAREIFIRISRASSP
jgi:hypothetical protein